MIKKLTFLTLVLFLLAGCTLRQEKAGLEIKSTPSEAKVFINDKEIGKTPYKDQTFAPGDYNIKLQLQDATYSQRVRLLANTVYFLNRDLNADPAKGSGESVNLEKGRGVTIITQPSQVEISLDSQKQGNSPYLIPNITAGTHELTLTKEGYLTKTIKINAQDGYKIVIEAQLKANDQEPTTSESPEPSSSAAAASSSPNPSTSPSPKTSASPNSTSKPSPTTQASATASSKPVGDKSVTILSTPTGWLRVREKADINSAEIAKVNTGETFTYEERLDSGWTMIVLTDGSKGYVSSRYVKVN